MAASLQQPEILAKIRTPTGVDKVYKDECALSFDSPESETGLYVCMNRFLGYGRKHVLQYYEKTNNAVFLHLRTIKREAPPAEDDPPKKKPTKMAIGVEGGFAVDEKKYEFEYHNSIFILPQFQKIELTDPNLPEPVRQSAEGIITAESAARAEELAAMAGTWEGEKINKSKHADNLVQLDNGIKIPTSGWKCSMCDKRDNLWANLSDGTILCGRKYFDGTGGNNHAIEYFHQTRYPLVVKLGTITPNGADVYSYDEDEMVEDPHLAKHLAHFGINMMKMEKTDKTMVELEIDLNQKVGEWDIIQESNSKLAPVYGPGFTGMKNLGNSCYMNSVMQVLFSFPDFRRRYVDNVQQIFRNAAGNPSGDFTVQMAKLGNGLLSGDYSHPPPEGAGDPQPDQGIHPQMFKTLIGRGHAEFSTKRQQDAQEFILHMFNLIERSSRDQLNPCDCFKFQIEERIQCIQSKKVKYSNREENILALPIPMDVATNMDEVAKYEAKKKLLQESGHAVDPKEIVRPKISLKNCIDAFLADEVVDDFYSTALESRSVASKRTRISTFPDYLIIQLKKFTIGDDWTPKKLDVSMDMPDEVDFGNMKGAGKQTGEEDLPEPGGDVPAVQIDPIAVQQLSDMGFPAEACKKAVYMTKNAGVEIAMQWVMEHMEDADFAAPFVIPSKEQSSAGFTANEEHIIMLMSMGFTREQTIRALKATDNNLERAADWIFSHANEPMDTGSGEAAGPQYRDGNTKYKLVAFISHMGMSTQCGHYVCHILKDGRWTIFNDENVALSEHPPKDLAYIYFYQRL
ncbi:ubiquitin carboxyl-terminal hydrolase 5-like [Lineus longissimus]|uniref:ubiquitin carboxyl-terminal hydrolase 5-like n=1 Tax=Lineus longissimus TaxID=88925 RepID=UPI002B4F28F1